MIVDFTYSEIPSIHDNNTPQLGEQKEDFKKVHNKQQQLKLKLYGFIYCNFSSSLFSSLFFCLLLKLMKFSICLKP